MQSTKFDSRLEEVWSSLTLKLVQGLEEIMSFDGEASTSKQDIEEQLVPDRRVEGSY